MSSCRCSSWTVRTLVAAPRSTGTSPRLPPASSMHRVRLSVASTTPVHTIVLKLDVRVCGSTDLVDDYYLNLLSWGKRNVLAVALGQAVYLWNADTGEITHLVTLPERDDYITSVSWMEQVRHGHTGRLA
jgi:cell division cycle 20, cofactor of APC complex